jgi:hypothetical protein
MNGLDKLNTTKSEVATLQQQLAEQQPVLEQTTIEVQAQQVQIAKDKEEATVVQKEAADATVRPERALSLTLSLRATPKPTPYPLPPTPYPYPYP